MLDEHLSNLGIAGAAIGPGLNPEAEAAVAKAERVFTRMPDPRAAEAEGDAISVDYGGSESEAEPADVDDDAKTQTSNQSGTSVTSSVQSMRDEQGQSFIGRHDAMSRGTWTCAQGRSKAAPPKARTP